MSELLDSWRWKDTEVSSFFKECEDAPKLLNLSVKVVREHILAAQKPDHSLDRAMLINLWRTVYEYHEDGLYLILCRRFDAAFALMRLAAELIRDIARMAEDPAHFEMWMNKAEKKNSKEYRKVFKFRLEDKTEAFIYSQYKMFSEIGVHGHLTGEITRELSGKSSDGEFVELNIPRDAVSENIGIWGLSFLTGHQLCARIFKKEIEDFKLPVSLDNFSIEAGQAFRSLISSSQSDGQSSSK